MKQRIVVFAGYAGSGKSTAMEVFRGKGFERAPLAGPLKAMLGTLLDLQAVGKEYQKRMLDGDLKEAPDPVLNGETPRRAMQLLGTEFGRALSPTLWLDTWRRYHGGLGHDVCVDDCRFGNEAAFLKSLGAEVYLIKRPGFQQRMAHSSEDLSWAEGLPVIWNDFASALDFQVDIEKRFF